MMNWRSVRSPCFFRSHSCSSLSPKVCPLTITSSGSDICMEACEPVCPVKAILIEDETPEQWKHFRSWGIMMRRVSLIPSIGLMPSLTVQTAGGCIYLRVVPLALLPVYCSEEGRVSNEKSSGILDVASCEDAKTGHRTTIDCQEASDPDSLRSVQGGW